MGRSSHIGEEMVMGSEDAARVARETAQREAVEAERRRQQAELDRRVREQQDRDALDRELRGAHGGDW